MRTIAQLFVTISFMMFSKITFADNILGFESAEHIAAGAKVNIFFSDHDHGQVNYPINLPNGLKVTYGEIVSLGDFYEIPGNPISLAESPDEKRTRFMNAFKSFAENSTSVSELPQILGVIQNEQKTINNAIEKGEKPEDAYRKIAGDESRQFNCITGGGCSGLWYLHEGRYLKLSKQDLDHFGENAWSSYLIGHTLALEAAAAAHQNHDVNALAIAYAVNAFACHFLSDRFASGHIRTPRTELYKHVSPSVVGSLLAGYMHNEENHSGLHVHNNQQDHWVAYGDRNYFDTINTENRKKLEDALQLSANEIFAAYQQGSSAIENTILNLLPQADADNADTGEDIAPLFYWDDKNQQLLRRTDVSNPQDHHWTKDWWGWTTLVLLAHQRGLPVIDQSQLVAAGYGTVAEHYGLITDKNLILQITGEKNDN